MANTTTATPITTPITPIPIQPTPSPIIQATLSTDNDQITADQVVSLRGKNITWPESFALLQLMTKEGKNWGKLLELLHGQHLFTHIPKEEKDKLRIHYNSLKGKKSTLWKAYTTPKFTPTPGSTPAQQQAQLQQHSSKHGAAAKERELARKWVKQIEDREVLVTSDQQKTEEEIRKEMKEKGEERRQIREERLEQAEKMV